jgi:nucleoside-diphosphate-sugar epimerase
MRVLLTGSTGFIGANLLRRLLQRGDEVHCIIRKPNINIEGLGVRTHVVPLRDNPTDVDTIARIADGFDGIYHLAGMFDPTPGGGDRMMQLHVLATRGLLRAAEKAGVRRFVYCSSSITVAFGSKDSPGTEDMYLDAPSIYGKKGSLYDYYATKRQAELLVMGWHGIEGVVVNPDYIIGAWDVKPTSGALIQQMTRFRIPFYPKGGKCFLGANDCSDAHIAAMTIARPHRRYLLGHHNYSYREFMNMTAEIVGCKPPSLPLPSLMVRAATRFGRLAQQIDAHRFAGLDGNVLRAMQQERYRSGQRMCSELGIQPKPLEKSIESAYRWFVENGYV